MSLETSSSRDWMEQRSNSTAAIHDISSVAAGLPDIDPIACPWVDDRRYDWPAYGLEIGDGVRRQCITNFTITDGQDCPTNIVFERPLNDSTPCYCVGYLVPPPGSELQYAPTQFEINCYDGYKITTEVINGRGEVTPIQFKINDAGDYSVASEGINGENEIPVRWFVDNSNGIHYRLMDPAPCFRPIRSPIHDITYVNDTGFDWPNFDSDSAAGDDVPRCRRLAYYYICNKAGFVRDVLGLNRNIVTKQKVPSGTFCVGVLIPPPGSKKQPTVTRFDIGGFSYDFSSEKSTTVSINRGFWYTDRQSIYYKLLEPVQDYKEYAQESMRFAIEVIKIVDVIIDKKCGATPYVTEMKNGMKRQCFKTLQEINELTEGFFDFDILWNNRELVDHALSDILTAKCRFMTDLNRKDISIKGTLILFLFYAQK